MRRILFIIVGITTLSSCNKYLDVVPDNLATLENAFTLRITAERYLFTCYSWLPEHSNRSVNPALLAGDELWLVPTNSEHGWSIAKGLQVAMDPILNYWDGKNGGKAMFRGIRDCNIFLENVHDVPDLMEEEKARWIAEVQFLKAYYHYWLLRMYGPIPIVDENLPISATSNESRVSRQPVDDVVDYIVSLLDEAAENLPLFIDNRVDELGRITQPIAKAIKAEVLVLAASPLFNGNADYTNLKNNDGVSLVNTQYMASKWERAAAACKDAIDLAHELGYALYEFAPLLGEQFTDTTRIQMSIRNSVAARWNSEVIWANPASAVAQGALTPRTWDPSYRAAAAQGQYGPPLKIAELFYSENGVPIDEDKTYPYDSRYELRVGTHDERYNIKEGYTTASLNFNRENRFYASLGFDGGIWYGQGRFDDNNPFYIMGKSGQAVTIHNVAEYSVSGYWPKKLINYQNKVNPGYTINWYSLPIVRLASLYLYYSEALNEISGPTDAAFEYINKVRERAGLESVQNAWDKYADNSKYTTKEGFREIIQQERMIEFIFEGHRYWDLKRWKRAHIEYNKPITGWDIFQSTEATYYQEVVIFNQIFRQRDYLWPISEDALIRNSNLVQNPGW